MNWINEYLAPGPYVDPATNMEIVVLEVVNNTFSVGAVRQIPLADPYVIYRKLSESNSVKHERYSMHLSLFNNQFKPL